MVLQFDLYYTRTKHIFSIFGDILKLIFFYDQGNFIKNYARIFKKN